MDDNKLPTVQLVDNAASWLKMYSNWVFMFISFMGVVQIVQPFMFTALPDWATGLIAALIGVAGILARLLKQFNISPPEQPQ